MNLIFMKIKHDNYEQTVIDADECVHCGYCVFACRDNVYRLDKFKGIVVVDNPDACTSCNECACPFGARSFLPYNEEVAADAYGLIGTQEYII